MSKVLTDSANYSAIADAIREKTGSSDTYKPSEMADAIAGIEISSGDNKITIRLDKITDCSYKIGSALIQFLNDNNYTLILDAETWDENLFIQLFMGLCGRTWQRDRSQVIDFNKIQLSNRLLSLLQNNGGLYMREAFAGSQSGGSYGTLSLPSWCQYLKPAAIPYMFSYSIIDTIPEFDTSCMGTNLTGYMYWDNGGAFNQSTIKTIPKSFTKAMKYQVDPAEKMTQIYADGSFGYCAFYNCTNLQKVEELGVDLYWCTSLRLNMFVSTFYKCTALTSFTFETNSDGSPIEASNWHYQTIDMTSTSSKYNHDSMVETINSLPDTSGNTTTDTNTIKFKGSYGGNDLTTEELAIATAKGWTVTVS